MEASMEHDDLHDAIDMERLRPIICTDFRFYSRPGFPLPFGALLALDSVRSGLLPALFLYYTSVRLPFLPSATGPVLPVFSRLPRQKSLFGMVH